MKAIQKNSIFPNDIIYWEGPGWYYYMNGWKRSVDQKNSKESDAVKFYSSRDEAKRIFCKVLDT